MSPAAGKKENLRRALVALRRMYGPEEAPRIKRGGGLDALVEAMLAQNTNWLNAVRGYRMLRRQFPTWAKVMDAPLDDVQRQIAVCGLARMRARRIQAILRAVREHHGRLSIDHLADRPTAEVYDYLTAFHGVGPKTAAFTLLFGLGHPVLPVDNAVLRVLWRLRLIRPKARDLEAQRVLSPLVADGAHHATHVLMFQHAKDRCRPRNPKCDGCGLLSMCPHGRRVLRHEPPERGAEPVSAVLRRRRPAPPARFASAGVIKHGEQPD